MSGTQKNSSYDAFKNMIEQLGLDLVKLERHYQEKGLDEIALVHPVWGPESLKLSRMYLLSVLGMKGFNVFWNTDVLRHIWIKCQLKAHCNVHYN